MNKLLIFAGTTEGRELSEYLAASQIAHTICVATEYGRVLLKSHSLVQVRQGRMQENEIRSLLEKERFLAVIDATHPYAEEITQNIKAVIKGMGVPCLRLKRESCAQADAGNVTFFESNEDCAKALEAEDGNILLTVGSKGLPAYCAFQGVKDRLFVRVLPGIESLSLCIGQGISPKRVIAMQGPFTTELNEAIIRQYGIACLVTKESGMSGGYPEKLEAAKRAGIQVFAIGRPQEEEGSSFAEICHDLEQLCGKKFLRTGRLEIVLAGIGMGHPGCVSKEAQEAIQEADILLGAERVLAHYQPKLEKRPFYKAEQILPYLREVQEKRLFLENKKIVALFSGDSGFYSGCQGLYQALHKEIQQGNLRASLRILPGISSVSYLAAQLGESYQDASICSMHGKEMHNLANLIKHAPKAFLLTSGVQDVNRLGKELLEANMPACEIVTGYQLSYGQQRIEKHTAEECCFLKEEGLYTCFIKNPYAIPETLTPGIEDTAFIRGQAPMTKEEIREIIICKLQLHRQAVVYDIGSGTGSVAVEIARLSDKIQVYAIERKREAVSLIERNRAQFHLQNIRAIEAEAPEGMEKLPVPTHAFIGGSGGKLKEIVSSLYRKNPRMRIVISAITIETICEVREILSLYKAEKEEIVQIQASRSKKRGRYRFMLAENPVWVCAFTFSGYCSGG